MNEKILKQSIAFACFGFALFCVLWIAGTYLLVPSLKANNDYSMVARDPEWIYVSLAGLLSSIFCIFAVFGIFYVSRDAGNRMFIGTVLLVLGLLLEMASLTWDAFIWPVVCADDRYIGFVREGNFIRSPQFLAFIISLLACLFFGSILTALGLLKAKRYGVFVPVLIIAGILLYGIGNLLLIHIASFGLLLYSLAFVLIGLKIRKT